MPFFLKAIDSLSITLPQYSTSIIGCEVPPNQSIPTYSYHLRDINQMTIDSGMYFSVFNVIYEISEKQSHIT